MKSFTYVAAIVLLATGPALAQSGSMNRSGSMNMDQPGTASGSGSMNRSSMDRSHGTISKSVSRVRSHHVARNGGADARENQETRQLNLQQLSGGNQASMAAPSEASLRR